MGKFCVFQGLIKQKINKESPKAEIKKEEVNNKVTLSELTANSDKDESLPQTIYDLMW